MIKLRTIRDIKVLDGIPVLVRAALNVPVENGKVVNDFRLHAALPTIEYLRSRGARVILAGHITGQGTETLEPMWRALQSALPGIAFCPVSVGPAARAAARAVPPGGVLMLENLRRNRGEQMNEKVFAMELAELADIFVEDCFDVCHRKHASVVGVPALLPAYAGLLVEREVKELSKALKPKCPSLAIICGLKFSTKEPVLKVLLKKYDHVFVGGALGNDFIKSLGHPVGTSAVSDAKPETLKELLKNKRLQLPVDVVVAPVNGTPAQSHLTTVDAIPADMAALDAGPKTIALLAALIKKSKAVLWNGPLGHYENGFSEGTQSLARAIAASKTYSVIGGGDTVAVVEELHIDSEFSFISTGGGAMLDFLAKGTLPGLEVLKR